jgi:hypothetical protein
MTYGNQHKLLKKYLLSLDNRTDKKIFAQKHKTLTIPSFTAENISLTLCSTITGILVTRVGGPYLTLKLVLSHIFYGVEWNLLRRILVILHLGSNKCTSACE